MLKKYSEFFLTLLIASDLILTVCAFFVAFLVRFEIEYVVRIFPLQPGETAEDLLSAYLPALYVIVPVSLFVYSTLGLYQAKRWGRFYREVFDIVRASLVVLAVLLSLAFFYREVEFSRGIILIFAIVNPAFLIVGRGLARKVARIARRRGYNLRHVLIVGSGRLGQKLAQTLGKNRWTGIRISGFIDWRIERVGKTFAGVPVLALTDEVDKIAHDSKVDQVFLCFPYNEQERLRECVAKLALSTVDVRIVPDYLGVQTTHSEVSELGDLSVISILESPYYGWNRILKRAFDIVFSLVVLIVLSPIYLIVALFVKLTSPGPIFYGQERCGLDGKSFTCWKFRSMRTDAEQQTGAVWAVKDDPRRTKFGTFIRKTSIDELPQFWNVFVGDMSVVGPRPERPVFIEEFKQHIPKYMLRHKMKAGITGWAQVHGYRGDTSLRKRIQYDLYYIQNWSLMLDIKCIFLTFFTGLINKNAY
ncbi:MAG: undecaprenyl-phosphate glucose phosphotransferase [Planctomycetes bacterium]|nr:undecaprenyl-phosphate glucose phosphotransferase [Planctomycetota bacterium]